MKKGSNCTFDPKTGIKTYKTKEMCEEAYNNQLKAHQLGIAPPVIKRVDDVSYQTAVADTDFFMTNFREGVYYNVIFPQLHDKLKSIFKEGTDRKKWGPEGIDLARHNLGLYEGAVVMLDFY